MAVEDSLMQASDWSKENLKKLLTEQQEEFQSLGIDLRKESNEIYFQTFLTHRLKLLSYIPKECQRIGALAIDVGGGVGRLCGVLSDLGLKCVNLDWMFFQHNLGDNSVFCSLKSYLQHKNIMIASSDINVDGIPFSDNTFDLAISSEVIEHMPNSPKPMLSDIYRTLKKGGWFILTTPNFAAIGNRIRALLGYSTRDEICPYYNMKLYPAGTPFRGHNREYIVDEVYYMLNQVGFNIIELQTFNIIPDLNTFFSILKANKLFDNITLSFKFLIYIVLDKIFKNLNNYIIVLARK